MIIRKLYPGAELHQDGQFSYVYFTSPHRVISTGLINGGLREDLQAVYNQRVCEPNNHLSRLNDYQPNVWHNKFCQKIGLDPKRVTGAETAANMNALATSYRRLGDLQVFGLSTAGVHSNAGCAADPTDYFEWDGKFSDLNGDSLVNDSQTTQHTIEDPRIPGTIVTLIFINQKVQPGALVKAVVTASEAKTFALRQLRLGSRFSENLATGTGTDQIIICSLLDSMQDLTGTGHHSKLGQFISEVTIESIQNTLANHHDWTSGKACDLIGQWARLGVNGEGFVSAGKKYLSGDQANLLADNLVSLTVDPATVGAAAGLLEVAEQLKTKIIPADAASQVLASAAATVYCATASRFDLFETARNLAGDKCVEYVDLPYLQQAVQLLYWSAVTGFAGRWTS